MGVNDQYTNEESAYDQSFSGLSTCCSTECNCGRVYFVDCEGHGDYSEGELEGLRESAAKEPSKYFASTIFDTVALDDFGNVIQCECGGARKYIKFLEKYRSEIVTYLRLRLEQVRKEQAADLDRTMKQQVVIDEAEAVS